MQVVINALLDAIRPHLGQRLHLHFMPLWLIAVERRMEHKQTDDGLKTLLQTARLLVWAWQDLRRSSEAQQWLDEVIKDVVPELVDLESTLLPAR